MNTTQTPSTSASHQLTHPEHWTKVLDDGTQLQIALPGVPKENLKLSVREQSLHLEALRPKPEGLTLLQGCDAPQGYRFEAKLDERLDSSSITARFTDGILTLHVPLRKEALAKSIEIN